MNPSKLLTPIAIAAYCLSAAAAPTGGARRFAPVGFVARKGDGNNGARLVPAREFQGLVAPASLVSFRGGGASEEAEGGAIKADARDVVSYVTDVALTCVLIFFGYYWIRSKIRLRSGGNYDEAPPFFFKRVLEDGFCNKEGGNTQLLCCIADFAMVAVAGVIAKGKGGKVFETYLPFAAYTIVHGLIHLGEWVPKHVETLQVESSGWRKPVFTALGNVLDPLGVILLAIITGLAPYALGSVLRYATEKPVLDLLPYCIPPWLAAVALFNSGVGFDKADALTYINFVTFLCFYTPRALLMGLNDPKQIKARRDMDKIFGNFTAFTVTSVIVFFIMVSEPIYCGTWFGKAGGHLLFDFALYAYLNVPVFTKPAEE